MKSMLKFLVLSFAFAVSGCTSRDENPPMEGFNLAGSDPYAIELADKVMNAQGGRHNWDKTRHFQWTLFGQRHWWDKMDGNFRIETDTSVVLMNVKTKVGRMWIRGVEVPQTDELKQNIAENYYARWINDMYWFLMPFKLKDSGVTLKYLGDAFSKESKKCDVITITFDKVGMTPQNKYEIYIDRKTDLVCQWNYFRDANDPEPTFKREWGKYETYGNLKLGSWRGINKDREVNVTDIAVYDELPASVYESPEKVEIKK